MSQVNATSFKDASGGSNAVLYGVAAPANSMGFRNRIINGDMRVAQRGASFSGFSDGAYTLDRWFANFSGGGVYSVAQSSDAPAGFTNSTLITVTTADGSIGSSDYYIFTQRIEGYNVADLAYGSASAAPITVSFWVKSSVTGTYAVSLLAYNASYRNYVSTVTINVANTWEYKSFSISGDTASVIRTNSNWGLALAFDFGCGSVYNTTAGSWGAGERYGTSGSTKLISTSGATFYITGVQLEAGSVASPFERRDYGRELMMCQRYCQVLGGDSAYERFADGVNRSSTIAGACTWLQQQMRAIPTVSFSSANHFQTWNGTGTATVTGIAADQSSRNVVNIDYTVSSGLTTNAAIQIIGNNTTSARLFFSAEL